MKTLISQMQEIVDEKVHSYKTDFIYDAEWINSFDAGDLESQHELTGRFVWVVRPHGTHLFPEYTRDAIRSESPRPFLFGKSTPDRITRGHIDCITSSTFGEDVSFYIVDIPRSTLKLVTRSEAARFFEDSLKDLREKYKYIVRWEEMMGGFDAYVNIKLEKAEREEAPTDAVYHDPRINRWRTLDELTKDTRAVLTRD